MKKLWGLSRGKFSLLFVLLCAIAVLGVRFGLSGGATAKEGVNSKIGSRSKGNPQAELYIVEYIDFQCPACARGAKMLDDYFEKYPQRIFLDMRYFPLPMHRHGLASARYAQCAAEQGGFWPFYRILLGRQKDWANLVNARPLFGEIAREAGLDPQEIDKCLKQSKTEQAVDKDLARGNSLGVKSTPTYFINGRMVVGAREMERELKGYFK